MKKKSKLTRTDVNAICELQRKIDAYESYIIGLCGLAQHHNPFKRVIVLRDTELDNLVNQCWNDIEEMKDRLQRYEKLYGKEASDDTRTT
jgi:hypothetical protein